MSHNWNKLFLPHTVGGKVKMAFTGLTQAHTIMEIKPSP